MYGFGGQGLSFFSAAQHMGRCTQTQHCTVYPFLFRITVTVSIAFFRQGGDPIRADIPCLWTGTYFFNFCQSCNLRAFTGTGCVFRSQNWAAKAVASAVVRMSCSLCVHAGCCEPAVRGLFALLADFSRVTCTQFAPPERALFRTKGFCGASGDATARGVDLYDDMVAACLQKQAESNTGIVQNGRKSQIASTASTASRPGVFRIALFKGFPNIPHIPLPPEHSVGANEGTMAQTPENPESWKDSERPRETWNGWQPPPLFLFS